ncbi:MAG: class I SAM-dependent DNA methyltransferase, partial [Bacteroidia bacterium]|nr:class I SAM-dependent DNA methyltransferase [Bacteroidia bacterium]MDW8333229.1 class I SAM-dependent DNA methyltransferase [Bacteroidia bacterium]
MPLSWNEIRQRAVAFVREWAGAKDERADAKSFWDEFFHIFGVSRRRVAAFELPVRKADGGLGFIDLFWKGTLVVEHKSKGKSLEKAYDQSLEYFAGLKEEELPRYVVVSDFARFRFYDLDEKYEHSFALEELPEHIRLFGFIAGYTVPKFKDEDPANLKAAELVAELHDALEADRYPRHDLERLLTRILFCLFADDTGIFEKDLFTYFIENHTKADGSDLGRALIELFETLDTPEDQRQTHLDEDLAKFPYVDGALFQGRVRTPAFNAQARQILLRCCYFDWSKISPAVFGSLFQAVLQPKERRNLGAHYTSETNVLKLIRSLFLDQLHQEFEAAQRHPRKLETLHQKIARMRLLDPACGCGNFLIVAYRELRQLEIQILVQSAKLKGLMDEHGRITGVLDVQNLSLIDVDQFYGIEYDEFAAKIAETALWMTDHQMNIQLSNAFGQYYVRLPLRKSPRILHANALRTNWTDLLQPQHCSFILGNPPFVGK